MGDDARRGELQTIEEGAEMAESRRGARPLGGRRRPAAAGLVEEDEGPPLRQKSQGLQKVTMVKARAAVDNDQRRTRTERLDEGGTGGRLDEAFPGSFHR